MKNTCLPLDMLFVDNRGRLVQAEHTVVPHSLHPLGPGGPVRTVLEINAGAAVRFDIYTLRI